MDNVNNKGDNKNKIRYMMNVPVNNEFEVIKHPTFFARNIKNSEIMELDKEITSKCINHKSVFESGRYIKINGIEGREYSVGYKFYKSMSGYITPENSRKYMKNNPNDMIWLGGKHKAYQFNLNMCGGINVFKVTSPIKLIDFHNEKNLDIFVEYIKNNEDGIKNNIISLDILRHLTGYGYTEEIIEDRFVNLFGWDEMIKYDKVIDKYIYTLFCDEEIKRSDKLNPMNGPGDYYSKEKYQLGEFYKGFMKKYGFDGIIKRNTFSKYAYNGLYEEEVIIPCRVIDKNTIDDTLDPIYWINWKSDTINLPKKDFTIPMNYSAQNIYFRLINHWHNNKYKGVKKYGKDSIMLYNVRGFKNIYQGINIKTNFFNILNMMRDSDVNLIFMSEFDTYSLSLQYISKKMSEIGYKYNDIHLGGNRGDRKKHFNGIFSKKKINIVDKLNLDTEVRTPFTKRIKYIIVMNYNNVKLAYFGFKTQLDSKFLTNNLHKDANDAFIDIINKLLEKHNDIDVMLGSFPFLDISEPSEYIKSKGYALKNNPIQTGFENELIDLIYVKENIDRKFEIINDDIVECNFTDQFPRVITCNFNKLSRNKINNAIYNKYISIDKYKFNNDLSRYVDVKKLEKIHDKIIKNNFISNEQLYSGENITKINYNLYESNYGYSYKNYKRDVTSVESLENAYINAALTWNGINSYKPNNELELQDFYDKLFFEKLLDYIDVNHKDKLKYLLYITGYNQNDIERIRMIKEMKNWNKIYMYSKVINTNINNNHKILEPIMRNKEFYTEDSFNPITDKHIEEKELYDIYYEFLKKNNYDGFIKKQLYSKFDTNGITKEEIIVRNDMISIDIKDEIHCGNWLNVPNIIKTDPVLLNENVKNNNTDFRQSLFYSNNNINNYNVEYIVKNKNITILSYNVHGFKNINMNISSDDNLINIINMISKVSPDIVCFQEVFMKNKVIEHMKDIGYMYNIFAKNGTPKTSKHPMYVSTFSKERMENITIIDTGNYMNREQIYFEYKGYKITNVHLEIGKRYHGIKNETRVKEIIKLNSDDRIDGLTKVIKVGSNIIVGDFNFGINTEENKYLEKNNFKNNNNVPTNPHGTITDTLYSNDINKIDSCVLKFNYSDHLPVVFSINQ